MHVLFVRYSSLGDVVLATAAVNFFKTTYPDCWATFLTAEEFIAIPRNCPVVDESFGFQRKSGLNALGQLLKTIDQKRKVDLIIDLHSSLRSSLSRWFLWKTPRWTIDKRRWERHFLKHLKLTFLFSERDKNAVARLKEDGRFLWGKLLPTRPYSKLQFSKQSQQDLLERLNLKDKNFAIIAPVAAHALKRHPMKFFEDLGRSILAQNRIDRICWLGGPGDQFLSSWFDSLPELELKKKSLNLQGQLSLTESLCLLGSSRMVLGNDTGLLHAAEAQGVPVVTLFGPTASLFGFAPHLKKSHYFERSDLFCHPCTSTGKGKCYRGQQFCLQHDEVQVHRAVLELASL